MTLKPKVIAYVTRDGVDGPELLVFDHRDFPLAGTQVPAGTVEPGETPQAAVLRELAEDSGVTSARLLRKLGEAAEPALGCYRHYYQLPAPAGLPATWDWTTNDFHDDADRVAGRPLIFCFRWVRLETQLTLAGGQHRFIGYLLAQDFCES